MKWLIADSVQSCGARSPGLAVHRLSRAPSPEREGVGPMCVGGGMLMLNIKKQ